MTDGAGQPHGPMVLGSWPKDCVQRAFVDGAAWWQFKANGATSFASERDEMEAEAINRYGEPMPDERLPPDPMGDDTRAAIVRDLTEWWSNSPHPEIKRLSPATIRQMAMEAGAFARGVVGEIAEIKEMARGFEVGEEGDPHHD
jgi:hypothetical protein